MRPVPADAPASLLPYLTDLEQRLQALEVPEKPTPLFACASSAMPPASAWQNHALFNTTLSIVAVSDGTSWIRQDTGAAI